MKIMLFALATVLLSGSLSAQFWSDTYADAQTQAKAEGKNIVLVFAGSDWCAPCIRLEREIWEAEGFSEMGAKDFVFYRADFPRQKANRLADDVAERNAQLAEQYNTGGSFPLVVVLTPEGKVLGQTGYQHVTPTEYLAVLQGFTE